MQDWQGWILVIILLVIYVATMIAASRRFKMDDKKKLKQDRKRIALTQPHEVAYLKRICKEQLSKLKEQEGNKLWGQDTIKVDYCSKAKLMRICKALIKCLEAKR